MPWNYLAWHPRCGCWRLIQKYAVSIRYLVFLGESLWINSVTSFMFFLINSNPSMTQENGDKKALKKKYKSPKMEINKRNYFCWNGKRVRFLIPPFSTFFLFFINFISILLHYVYIKCENSPSSIFRELFPPNRFKFISPKRKS